MAVVADFAPTKDGALSSSLGADDGPVPTTVHGTDAVVMGRPGEQATRVGVQRSGWNNTFGNGRSDRH